MAVLTICRIWIRIARASSRTASGMREMTARAAARNAAVIRRFNPRAGLCAGRDGGDMTGASAAAARRRGVRKRTFGDTATGLAAKMRAACSGPSAKTMPSFRNTTGMGRSSGDASSRRAISLSTREMPSDGSPASISEVVTSTKVWDIPSPARRRWRSVTSIDGRSLISVQSEETEEPSNLQVARPAAVTQGKGPQEPLRPVAEI